VGYLEARPLPASTWLKTTPVGAPPPGSLGY